MTSQGPERVTNEILHLAAHLLCNLDKSGIVRLGSWVEVGDILVGKLTPRWKKNRHMLQKIDYYEPYLAFRPHQRKLKNRKRGYNYNPEMIHKREIEVGNEVAGRHENKGIISKILPRQDMPYLQDGRLVDMIFEYSLRLVRSLLDRHYRIAPFDERYEQEVSRKLVFSELYEAKMLTYKSDHIKTPQKVFNTTIFGGTITKPEVIGDGKEDRCFCEQCRVEFVNSRVQRYQMGYIKLPCPVTHVDKPLKELEGPIYCDFSFARPIGKKPTFFRLRGLFEYENQSWKYRILLFFTIQEWKELGEEGPTGNEWEDRKAGRRKDFLIRRMELAKHFIRTNIEPEWMVFSSSPELRPIIQIDGGKFISSDINELYRRVIIRSNILTGLLTSGFMLKDVVMSQEKFLQEAVDTLLDNGICGQPMRDGHNKVYKSFSDVKGEDFGETVLGKHIDYSGRSVIVVGPSLSLHRCGLPCEIAIELFQIFVMRDLIRQYLVLDIGVAKSQI
ncbi:hypothetical protein Cgig2_009824 [Carnegiea gigantea]|uniref:DNA-directed RNA polymerase subunit n=1 Tax=Carnegiea gigantea TaxID=171969 RepID=A0A9Q1Q4I3_9CARY|nr:hypothetical protein Cgig2_009824 [Carnegiea gigantea]